MLKFYLIACSIFAVLTVYLQGCSGIGALLFAGLFFALYFVGLFLLWMIFLCIMVIPVKKEEPVKADSKAFRWATVKTLDLMLGVLNVHVSLSGTELLPKGRFLLVGNHKSGFDPLISLYILNKYQLGFITKPENMDIPVVGRVAHKICCLPIDRENPRNAVKTINEAAELIKNDVASVGIYPEGTRNRGEGLLPFHNGSFKIAVKAKAPVAVVLVKGSDRIKASAFLSRKNVTLKVLKVIPAEEVAASNTAELSEIAQKLLLAELEK